MTKITLQVPANDNTNVKANDNKKREDEEIESNETALAIKA